MRYTQAVRRRQEPRNRQASRYRHAARFRHLVYLAVAIALVGCVEPNAPDTTIVSPPYSRGWFLEHAATWDFADSILLQNWTADASRVIAAPTETAIPTAEEVDLGPGEPAGYRFYGVRGQRVTISLGVDAGSARDVFVDVYREGAVGGLVPVEVAGHGRATRSFEPPEDGYHRLVVQSRPLTPARLKVVIRAHALYHWPVSDSDVGDLLAPYSEPRQGGTRFHQGIDIAAPRGTGLPALVDAIVMDVSYNPLGGLTVSLFDRERNLFLYYAHLQRQLAVEREEVEAGTIIGTVGNTGSAYNTPPHLHLGIYDGAWTDPIDPWYFIVPPEGDYPPPAESPLPLGTYVSVSGDAMRHPPGKYGTILSPAWADGFGRALADEEIPPTYLQPGEVVSPSPGTPARLVGVRGRYGRIVLPSGEVVFAGLSDLAPMTSAPVAISSETPIVLSPQHPVQVGTIPAGGEVTPLGAYDGYTLVEIGEAATIPGGAARFGQTNDPLLSTGQVPPTGGLGGTDRAAGGETAADSDGPSEENERNGAPSGSRGSNDQDDKPAAERVAHRWVRSDTLLLAMEGPTAEGRVAGGSDGADIP